ncbi:HNH endonuclease [Mycobacterium helveticum]|uniref:HNH endonuclease n=1 Tax=Mycobacterium helveticum TaxID=2592811 RepID=A0A557XVG0_9MYCO|nr:HNH endonuclease [Mycobacterium helveticum]TVS86040.1 HNH endonuclease [Mycobacterium helveticum]TVS90021.1 HNH endonuclease [Mycobacterium helveticum]
MRANCLKRDRYRCQLRYPNICRHIAIIADHIQAGSEDTLKNLQSSCEPCHLKKASADGNAAQGHRTSIAVEKPIPRRATPTPKPNKQQQQMPRTIWIGLKPNAGNE